VQAEAKGGGADMRTRTTRETVIICAAVVLAIVTLSIT
jgi:hypothetical protein